MTTRPGDHGTDAFQVSPVAPQPSAAQAEQVFRNLAIALEASRCTPANLVKLTVFLTDMDNLGPYREARNRFFASVTPFILQAIGKYARSRP